MGTTFDIILQESTYSERYFFEEGVSFFYTLKTIVEKEGFGIST